MSCKVAGSVPDLAVLLHVSKFNSWQQQEHGQLSDACHQSKTDGNAPFCCFLKQDEVDCISSVAACCAGAITLMQSSCRKSAQGITVNDCTCMTSVLWTHGRDAPAVRSLTKGASAFLQASATYKIQTGQCAAWQPEGAHFVWSCSGSSRNNTSSRKELTE